MKKFILLSILSVLLYSAPGYAGTVEAVFAEELARAAAARARAAPAQQLVEGFFRLTGLSGEELRIKLGKIEVSVEENGYQPVWLTRRQGLYLIGFDGEGRHREEMLVRVSDPEAAIQMIPEGKRAAPGTVINDDSRVIPKEDILRQVGVYVEEEARRGCTIRWTGRPGTLIGRTIDGKGECLSVFSLLVDDAKAAVRMIQAGIRAAYAAKHPEDVTAEMEEAFEEDEEVNELQDLECFQREMQKKDGGEDTETLQEMLGNIRGPLQEQEAPGHAMLGVGEACLINMALKESIDNCYKNSEYLARHLEASGMEVEWIEEGEKMIASVVKSGTHVRLFQLLRKVSDQRQVLAMVEEKAEEYETAAKACLINMALKESIDNCYKNSEYLARHLEASGMEVEWIEEGEKMIASVVKSGTHVRLFQLLRKVSDQRQVLAMVEEKAEEYETAAKACPIHMELKASIYAFANSTECMDRSIRAHLRNLGAAQAKEAPEQEEKFTEQWVAKALAQIEASGMEIGRRREGGEVVAIRGITHAGPFPLILKLSRKVNNPIQVLEMIGLAVREPAVRALEAREAREAKAPGYLTAERLALLEAQEEQEEEVAELEADSVEADSVEAVYNLAVEEADSVEAWEKRMAERKARKAATAKTRKATVAGWVAEEVKKEAVRASELTAEAREAKAPGYLTAERLALLEAQEEQEEEVAELEADSVEADSVEAVYNLAVEEADSVEAWEKRMAERKARKAATAKTRKATVAGWVAEEVKKEAVRASASLAAAEKAAEKAAQQAEARLKVNAQLKAMALAAEEKAAAAKEKREASASSAAAEKAAQQAERLAEREAAKAERLARLVESKVEREAREAAEKEAAEKARNAAKAPSATPAAYEGEDPAPAELTAERLGPLEAQEEQEEEVAELEADSVAVEVADSVAVEVADSVAVEVAEAPAPPAQAAAKRLEQAQATTRKAHGKFRAFLVQAQALTREDLAKEDLRAQAAKERLGPLEAQAAEERLGPLEAQAAEERWVLLRAQVNDAQNRWETAEIEEETRAKALRALWKPPEEEVLAAAPAPPAADDEGNQTE